MRPQPPEPEAWKRMVLQSQRKPAWLGVDAPHVDVVLSSRTRVMRNLRHHKFPHLCTPAEAQSIMREVLEAARDSDLQLEVHKGLTNAERDYLVGCRLVSPEFEWTLPGRALLIDQDRTASLMINEEDHLRIQSLTAGWSVAASDAMAMALTERLATRLDYAWSPKWGFLSASPFNAGIGKRQSAMFHLIGLATERRLPSVMKALSTKGIVVRGLFGESSRAIGAFVQVSVIGGAQEDFLGACEYLLVEERASRASISRDDLTERTNRAKEFVRSSRSVSLADALRILAWMRWATSSGIEPGSPRQIDQLLTTLDLRANPRDDNAGRDRAASLRNNLGLS